MKTQFIVAVACGSSILNVDGVYWDGKLWLVPLWHDEPGTNNSKPALMVRFDDHEYQEMSGGTWDYVVAQQVPRAVLDGESTERFETLSGEQITFAIQRVAKLH